MRDQREGQAARAEMEAAKAQSEKRLSSDAMPRRYRLYDKIKANVSLKTVDAVIIITALLIVALLIYGIATAQPPQ